MQIKFIKLNNLIIETANSGKGQDLLFLHGGSVSFRSYLPFILHLSKYFHVWVLSLPGAGKSSRLPKNWNFNNYRSVLKEFCEYFKINPVLLGHSFGGAVTVDSIVYYPNIFKKGIIFASAGLKNKRSLFGILHVALHKATSLLSFNKRYFPEYKKDIFINLFFHLIDMLKIGKMFSELDLSDVLKKIKSKCIIFWGKNDPIFNLDYKLQFESLIKNKKIYTLDGEHAFLCEKKEFITKEIIKELY